MPINIKGLGIRNFHIRSTDSLALKHEYITSSDEQTKDYFLSNNIFSHK